MRIKLLCSAAAVCIAGALAIGTRRL